MKCHLFPRYLWGPVSWSALIWPPKLTAEHWVAAEGAGRVCSAQGRPRLRSLVTITKSDHSPGLRRLESNIVCVLAWSGAWPQSPCLCERLGLTQCNRFPWWAMSDCWSLDTGPVPGLVRTSDPACDQLPDMTPPIISLGCHEGFRLQSLSKRGLSLPLSASRHAEQSPVINVIKCASCQPPPYLGYLIICRVINLLKETFGRRIVRAGMMTTESATKAESAPIVFKTGPIVWPGRAAVTYIVLSLTGHCQHG